MYLSRLSLSDFRCIEKANLQFQYPGRVLAQGEAPLPGLAGAGESSLANINLILGVNGSGKTSVLKAAAFALIAPVLRDSGYHPYSVIRRTRPQDPPVEKATVIGDVVLTSQDVAQVDGRDGRGTAVVGTEQLRVGFARKGSAEAIVESSSDEGIWAAMYDRASPAFLVVGYGATRRLSSNQSTDPSQQERRSLVRYLRVQSLFDEANPLIPLANWLPAMESRNKGRWKQVVNPISRALGDDYEFEGKFIEGEYQVSSDGIQLPMGALSDGYRTYIGWVGDMLYHICMGAPAGAKLIENCGVVLVDEIDLHLHPEWQRRVIPTLSATFPNIQFIFTTHSPIVVGSVERANIHVVGDNGPEQLPDAVSGLSAEQILLSPYFGLTTTRSDRKLVELRALEQKTQAAAAPADKALANEETFDAAMQFMRSLTVGSEALPDASVTSEAVAPASKRDSGKLLAARSSTRKRSVPKTSTSKLSSSAQTAPKKTPSKSMKRKPRK